MFGNIPSEAVISNPDVDNIYRAPFQLHTEGFDSYTISQLELKDSCDNSLLSPSENSQNGSVHVYDSPWYKTVSSPRNSLVNVTLLGKYQIEDSYMSVVEALNHAGMNTETEIDLDRCVTNNTEDIPSTLTDTDALIIPGGFDVRGVETKINALKYARENDIPTLGLCLGFQLMIVEYARNICGLNNAHSTEFAEDTPHPVIDIMPDQYDIEELGGSMRLGSYTADVKEGTKAYELYGGSVNGRHRHRYEMNPTYISTITDDYPLTFSAEMNNRMEIVELPTHPFYFGTQFHPEYTSRPTNPSTAFTELIKRAINYRTSRK